MPQSSSHQSAPGSARQSGRNGASDTTTRQPDARPLLRQRGKELQRYGTIAALPNGLDTRKSEKTIEDLNQILADTMTLRDLYKKHHWQVVGPTFYQLHLLFDKHFGEQVELVDLLAERIQILGGISIAMAPDVAETTRIERPPRGREEVPVQISRLLEAHELILKLAHEAAKRADEAGDDGTNDLLVSDVIRTNELQVWFVAEHLVESPTVRAE
ncbi:MAG TPA: DNA starvation/stationary phase protection protein [Chloroflexota bacterium]|jgi:starvation-inducible DNA-binding protein